MKTHLFKYFHDGSWWQFEIPAESEEEARARLKKLPHSQYLGTLVAKIPAGLGAFAWLICWWKNRGTKG